MLDEQTTTIAVKIPTDHDIKLRMVAAVTQMSKSEIVRVAIAEYLLRKSADLPATAQVTA
jgi:predicted transcriptional regulator